MNGFLADLRHALRIYLQTPLSSAMAIVLLAVAMATLAAFLSLFSDLALKPVPGLRASRGLVTIGQTDGNLLLPLSYSLIERIDEEVGVVESLAGVMPLTQYYARSGDREEIVAELVTASYFRDTQPSIQLGRGLEDADHAPAAEPAVVLSDAFWRKYLGGRAAALGETVRLYLDEPAPGSGGGASSAEKWQDYRIVGVMAPELTGTFVPNTAVWMPYEQAAQFVFGGLGSDYRNFAQLRAIARLADGTSLRAAISELNGRFADAGRELGLLPEGRLDAVQGVVANLDGRRQAQGQVRLFLAGSVLLALVAASNVSLFLFSRSPGRRRELAIRMALGAPLRRLARQLMTEAGFIVVAATVVGIAASIWVAAVLLDLPFLEQGGWRDVTPLDWRVLGLIVGFTTLLTALVSLAPLAALRRLSLGVSTRVVTARAGIVQQLAGTAQVVVAGVIGAAALAFVWHLVVVGRIDPGFSAPSVDVVAVEPPEGREGLQQDVDALRLDRIRRREVIGALPDVEAVGFGTAGPGFDRITMITPISPPDDPEHPFLVRMHTVDSAYFELLHASLEYGREFGAEDRDDVVIVNETLARRLWSRTDVVGEVVPLRAPPGARPPRREVIGVIRDIAFGHPEAQIEPMMFFNMTVAANQEWILIESPSSIADVRRELEGLIEAGSLEFRIESIGRLDSLWGRFVAPDRARTWLTVVAALVVIVLAAFGFYGTQRFLVAAGRREYAILSALGAGPRVLGRLVYRRGLVQGLAGLVLGSLLAFVVVAWLRSDFVAGGVSPATIALAVAIGILCLLLGATAGPARQASRTEPAPLLKEE